MTETIETQQRRSPLHAILSLVLPGLGQAFAGQIARGFTILAGILILSGLSIWTSAQRARFPDLQVSGQVYVVVVAQCLALLFLLIILRYVLLRTRKDDASAEAISRVVLAIGYIVIILIASRPILDLAGHTMDMREVYETTLLLSAAALASLWFWQTNDAASLGGGSPVASLVPGILIGTLLILSLGWSITGIDIPKAISEFSDTQVILGRIVWPWRNAFEYEIASVESQAKIQAPCPPGATGPAVNQPIAGEAWISVTPTCGDLTIRDNQGITLGTELTITGGGYAPGQTVEVKWKNPIGNPFTPRGVGETEITVGPDGGFVSTLNIPSALVADTAEGDQLHTLVIVQESTEVFTGRLSREMNLALVGILESIMIGLMATFFGIILAFPVSFLAARNLMTPIMSKAGGVIGGLAGLIPGVWAASVGTGYVIDIFGGLEEQPIVIAVIMVILFLGLGSLGWRLGAWVISQVIEALPESVGKFVIGLSFAVLAAVPGYFLGLGFSRGILSIPQSAEIAVINEQTYALIGAVFLGLAGATFGYLSGSEGEISLGTIVYAITRTILNIVRSIEPIIWALVAVIWVGLGPFAGTIALTLHTIAALGKLYSESIESIDPGPIEALQATGANRLQTIIYAVVPQILPPFISFTIYRWDINVRMSTIIGAVGGGGIGFILIQWIRQFQYDSVGLAVWLIAITVAILDFVSSNIRARYV